MIRQTGNSLTTAIALVATSILGGDNNSLAHASMGGRQEPAISRPQDQDQSTNPQIETIGSLQIHPVNPNIDLGFHRPEADPTKNVTGHGAFKAQLMQVLPLPEGLSEDVLKAAHGTVVARYNGDILWGLGNYGVVEYKASENYSTARRLPINFPEQFNLHGGELLTIGPNEYFISADNTSRCVYMVNLQSNEIKVIVEPLGAGNWSPTDVTAYAPNLDMAEKGEFKLLITNGYGSPAQVFQYDIQTGKYEGSVFVDFDGQSRTPHGISLGQANGQFSLAQREASKIQERFSPTGEGSRALAEIIQTFNLDHGIRPCDIDWQDFNGSKFACIPVLRGPGNNPGGIVIMNENGKVVSLINVNGDVPGHQHTHDATFVNLPGDKSGLVATSWNPGNPLTLYILVK